MGADIVAAFHNDYKGGVEEFEKKTGIQMPKDIARLLGYYLYSALLISDFGIYFSNLRGPYIE